MTEGNAETRKGNGDNRVKKQLDLERFARGDTGCISRRRFLKLAGTGLAGAALLGTVGCGGTGEQSSQGSRGGGSETVTIGALLPLSGPFAPLAEGIRNGMNLYFGQNQNKIGDRSVELVYEDSEGDPQAALRKYRQLVTRDQIDVLTGVVSSSVLLALMDQVVNDELPLIVSTAAANDLCWSKKNDYTYRVSHSDWQNGASSAPYIAENVGRTAYTIAADYPAGHETIAAFRAEYNAAGGRVITEAYPPLGNDDYATYLSEIRSSKPESVFANLTGTDTIRFLQQYESFGLKGEIPLSGPTTATLRYAKEVSTEPPGEGIGIVAPLYYSPLLENEANKRFVEAYQGEYGALPGLFGLLGYDSGQVISKAIQEAGSAEPADLIEVLGGGFSFESPRGSVTLDPETHNPILDYYITDTVVQNDLVVSQAILETVEDVTTPASQPG
jgi:branched-chain amino acid transport system substrate-binding protein